MAINPMDYSSKDAVLDIVRTERARFYEVIDNPDNWNVDSRCEGWEVRDLVGHMIDVTEGYLNAWERVRKGEDSPPPLPVTQMADKLNEGALSFRSLSREEAIARLKKDSGQMLDIFDNLTEEEYGSLNIPHGFFGPLPCWLYPVWHIVDYGIHTWDMHWGLGDKDAKLDERTAGFLVFAMFIVMQGTVDQKSAEGVDITYGIKVDGDGGGQWKITVKDGHFSYEPADDLSNLPAVFHYRHPSDFVLTAYLRIDGSTATGDPEVIETAKGLFFHI